MGLEKRWVSLTLKSVAEAQFVGLLLVVALFSMKINFRLVLKLSRSLSPSSLLSLLSFSPGHVFPWTQQARKQCILSLYQLILKISVLVELN